MKVIDAVKNTAFTAAINSGLKYLEKDPEVNIPKLMSLVDKAAPEGWYEGARNMIRNAIEEKGNWYDLIMKIYQLDPGVRKTFPELYRKRILKGFRHPSRYHGKRGLQRSLGYPSRPDFCL